MERLAVHAVRGEVWDKAVLYCRQAGNKARFSRVAPHEAKTYFDHALTALAHVPESPARMTLAIDLYRDLDVLASTGEYERDLTLMQEAEALARALNDQARLGQVLARKSFLLRMLADYEGAIEVGRQGLALAATLGDGAMQVAVAHRLAQAYFAIGDVCQAATLLRQNVEALEAGVPDPRMVHGYYVPGVVGAGVRRAGGFRPGPPLWGGSDQPDVRGGPRQSCRYCPWLSRLTLSHPG